MTSSRIFVKGLPPKLSNEEFQRHFSKISPITDAKLITARRIGYIGYKNSEDAAKAVKYFNKTFIRMSRISVEIARPISIELAPQTKNSKQELERVESKGSSQKILPQSQLDTNETKKRKWNDTEKSSFKLEEFLEVMQPPSKVRKQTAPELLGSRSTNMPVRETFPDPQIRSNYAAQEVNKTDICLTPNIPSANTLIEDPIEPSKLIVTSLAPNSVDDDEWVRNHTSRVLDLVNPQDMLGTMPNILTENCPQSRSKETARQFSENDDECRKEPEKILGNIDENSETDMIVEAIRSSARIFIRNLPYTASEENIRQHFSSYGDLIEIRLSIDATGKSKGFAHIQFADSATAIAAYRHLDGEPFQGRLLHIIPGHPKRQDKLDLLNFSNKSFSKKNMIKKKSEASRTNFNWNSLYMDQNAVNSAIASRLGVSKSEMLDPTSSDSAWKQAMAETAIIQESKAYFTSKGVDLASFKRSERGDTAILVKNIPHGLTLDTLRSMFENFGEVKIILMPPAGIIAIVEYAQPSFAKAAFANLAYRRLKDSILFLEKAPKGLFNSNINAKRTTNQPDLISEEARKEISVSDLIEKNDPSDSPDSSTLFVRNLNFATSSQRLADVCKPLDGFISARVSTKSDPRKPGQVLSMGFGFIEFKSKVDALSALKVMDGYEIDGYKLVVKTSHKGLDAAEERRKEDRNKAKSATQTKIVIKNLPFEATKKDVRSLFGAHGKLRSVRVPKKFNNSARGFAFADYVNSREAENALEALKNTHLLGRRLILEFASAGSVDAEEEIEKMQKKVDTQLTKVALLKLTGGGRKKFTIDNNEEDT